MYCQTVPRDLMSSMMYIFKPLGLAAIASLVLLGCNAGSEPVVLNQTTLITTPGEGPPDARPGACYGKDMTPAVVEVITVQVLLQPAKIAPDGAIMRPPSYKTSSYQNIIQERREFFFEVPCADVLTRDFIASLQRALKARQLYRGTLSGVMDARTRRAIRKFQIPNGLNSDILTLDTARSLGLVAYGWGADAG